MVAATCLEFFVNLLRFRFGRAIPAWRRSHPQAELRSASEKSAA